MIDNILNNFTDDYLISVGKIGYGLMICFSYPLMCFPARLISFKKKKKRFSFFFRISLDLCLFPNDQPTPTPRRVIIVTIFIVLSHILAILVPDITIVFSFVKQNQKSILTLKLFLISECSLGWIHCRKLFDFYPPANFVSAFHLEIRKREFEISGDRSLCNFSYFWYLLCDCWGYFNIHW